MGHCLSVEYSVHDAEYEYDHEDNVVFHVENNGSNNEAPRIASIYSHQGSKGLNQDAAILYEGYGVEGGVFCGVFDGHGKNGHIISKMVRNRLPALLLSQRLDLGEITCGGNSSIANKNAIKWKEACESAFKLMDMEIKSLERLDCTCSGSAAVVAIRQGDDLIIANLGDSRAIMGTKTGNGIKAVQLTTDLKPNLPSESERIKKCQGRVFSLRQEPDVARVGLPNDDAPALAMSRALGDFTLKNHGVISIPEVHYHQISPQDQFLVLATDGVWDVLSNDLVASIVCPAKTEDEAAKAIVNWSVAGWKHKFPTSRRDDITVVCLFLQKRKGDQFPPPHT